MLLDMISLNQAQQQCSARIRRARKTLRACLKTIPLLMCWVTITLPSSGFAQLFSDIDLNIPGVENHSVVLWVDFDNDGDLDIFMAGRTGSSSATSRLYENRDSQFVETNFNFGWMENCAADWGDYDQDGDMDLLLSGQGGDTQPRTWFFRNDRFSSFQRFGIDVNLRDSYASWIDFDNDCDLDMLIAGESSFLGLTTRLYENINNQLFTALPANFPGIWYAAITWGDYDNDGDLDLFFAGRKDLTDIFRNDGGGRWTQLDLTFPKIALGDAASGDYDNDGDLDILLTGLIDETVGAYKILSEVFRNDGNYRFTQLNSGMTGVYYSSVAWVDYDNDGDLDITINGRAGDDYNFRRVAELYRNDGGDVFKLATSELPNMEKGELDWGDYDRDGDFDLLVSGDVGGGGWIRLAHNELALSQYSAPMVTSNLRATVENYTALLSWDSQAFAGTPLSGLTYNLRIGTSPLGDDILSANADPQTGQRRIAKPGNIQKCKSWRIRDLEGGAYYWSVQAVAQNLMGSRFAHEQTFGVPPRPPQLLEPPGRTTGHATDVILKWRRPKAADAYELQFAADSNFSNLLLHQKGLADTSFQVTNLEHNTFYYWRVKASNFAGESDWSAWSNFKTRLAPPLPLSPVDQSVISDSFATLKWQPSEGANYYHVQVSSDENFNTLVFEKGQVLTDTVLVSGLLDKTNYYWHVRAFNNESASEWSGLARFSTDFVTSVQNGNGERSFSFSLSPNYPNPFNPSTTIRYSLAKPGHVTLKIFSLAGHEVATLVNENKTAGEYEAYWHANDLPSGVYVSHLKVGNDFTQMQKLLLLK